MLKNIPFLALVLMIGCTGQPIDDGEEPEGCTLEDTDSGVVITCPNGSAELSDGEDCSVTDTDGGSLITCTDGTETFMPDSKNCTVTEVDGGALVSCPDGTETLVEGGEDCSVDDVDGGALVSCPDGTETFLPDGAEPVFTTVEEPAGENCEFGGTAIIVNGTVLDYVCDGRGFPDCDVLAVGALTISSDLELAAFAGCRVLDGDVDIKNVTSLAPLASLEQVTGKFDIKSTNLTSLAGLENLKNFTVSQLLVNPVLADLSAFSPAAGTTVIVDQNPLITQCTVNDWVSTLDPGVTVTVFNVSPCQ